MNSSLTILIGVISTTHTTDGSVSAYNSLIEIFLASFYCPCFIKLPPLTTIRNEFSNFYTAIPLPWPPLLGNILKYVVHKIKFIVYNFHAADGNMA